MDEPHAPREGASILARRFLLPIKKLQISLQQISSEPALSFRFHRIEPMLFRCVFLAEVPNAVIAVLRTLPWLA